QWTGEGEAVPFDRLLQTCACSTQIWVAHDPQGTPTALWGVAPLSEDPQVGQLWMLACETFDNDPDELEELSRLVFGEMLNQFPRLENFIDSRKVRAIAMLRSLGFAIEPAMPQPACDGDLHRVWANHDRLHGGPNPGFRPNGLALFFCERIVSRANVPSRRGGAYMPQDRRSVRALAALLPAGTLGFSVSLASADATAALSSGAAPSKPAEAAKRLQSIRETISAAAAPAPPERRSV